MSLSKPLFLAAALLLALVSAAPLAVSATADPMAADAVLPGMTIYQTTPSGQVAACTAGFVVTTSQGGKAFLTAGHCQSSTGAVSMTYLPTGTDVEIGHYRASVNNSEHDIGLVGIEVSSSDVTSRVAGKIRVTGVVGADGLLHEKTGSICKFGEKTGPSCGNLVKVVGNQIWFHAAAGHGDSGAPVYEYNEDGSTVTAIGIVVEHSPNDDSITVAELIQPWLATWGLTLG